MTFRSLRSLPTVVAALIGCSGAPVTTAAAPAQSVSTSSTVITESDVQRLLTALADDSLEGRGTGTRGSAKAAALIANEMRAAGLEPAGDSGYFQRVPIAVVMRTMRDGSTRQGLDLLSSVAAFDTMPVAQRRNAVNVVGILRGTDPVLKDSVILIDAHYDHLGIGKPVNGDSIFNGADDDASGTVAVLEIARAMAKGPAPKRTVIFAATTGEEVGLLGTRWYVLHPAAPLSRMTANLEIEMIGRPDSLGGGAGKAWLTGFERSSMGRMFVAAGLPIVRDMRPEQGFFARSDNIAFANAGIPAHTLSSFNMHSDYHQLTDDATRVDFPHMTSVIRAGAAAARLLADGPAPRWYPGGRPVVGSPQVTTPVTIPARIAPALATPAERMERYTTVRLQADTLALTRKERQMLPLLIDAAREMHGIYWTQVIGPRDSVMARITDPVSAMFADVNVGPWDRLDNNVPFVPGVGIKPLGANFYPRDMTKAEFERAVASGGKHADSLKSLYTMVRRDASGAL
ncbi:MAG: M20/M25/M40 family metallo-hydrolase, partial [bacterium]